MEDQLVIIVNKTRGGNSGGRTIQRLTLSYFVRMDDNASSWGKLKESKNLVENETEYNGGGIAPQKDVDTHQENHLNASNS